MQTRWLFRITYFYLTIPFIIFCMGWLRLPIAIPVGVVILWALWQLLHRVQESQSESLPLRNTLYVLLITGIWVFLSGVGGYSFQNWDHHWRNAVLRDLISFDWPVYYSTPEKGPITMLIYYVGYWLPAAWAGKLLGWKFANFIFFLWTWLGILLTVLHLNLKLKTSLFKTSLLLIFFSGMDILGTLFFAKEYPTLWPPYTHLEIWSGTLQYSSFTTQLFWVFNQAVPAWLCIALILDTNVIARAVFFRPKQSPSQWEIASDEKQEHPRNDTKIFIWALCFFFAPLAALGLLPYVIIDWFKQTDIQSPLKNIRFDLLFASGMIVLISYFFFSSNTAAQSRGFQPLPIKDFLAFFLLDGGILWLLLTSAKWRDPNWLVTGLLLLIMPFIQLGSGRDFVMRASIAPLFHLMLMTSETLFQKTTPRILRFTLFVLLLFGALTPIYEINRSIYRSFEYYFILDESDCGCESTPLEPVTHLEQGVAPEMEHPAALVADEIRTLEFMNDKLSKNFIANVRQSLYYRFLTPR